MRKSMSAIGTLYAGLLDSNKNLVGGYKRVGNAYPFSIQAATEQKGQISRLKESAGQMLDSKTTMTEDGVKGSLVLRQWDAKNLAWALSGEAVALTGTGGTVSGESVTLIADEWVRLANKGVSSVVITGGTEGTDYEVNGPLGLVKMLSTGGLTAGANSAAYSYAAETGYQVQIGSKSLIRVALLLDGENEYDGSEFYGEFDSVTMASSAEINLISDPSSEYEELPFSLVFETLPGKTHPCTINGLGV